MRYFAIMSDNRVLPATGIVQGRYVDGIHFSIGSTRYKYLPSYYIDETKGYKITKHKHFFKLVDLDWFATEEIEVFMSLDEMEDPDLNYFQSTDFNAGIIYGIVERNTLMFLKDDNSKERVGSFSIAAIQMIPISTLVSEHDIIEATLQSVATHFNAVYGRSFTLKFNSWKRDKQYFRFDYTVTRKEVYKEMTVSEIEAALGYKIKVVADKE